MVKLMKIRKYRVVNKRKFDEFTDNAMCLAVVGFGMLLWISIPYEAKMLFRDLILHMVGLK